MFDRDSGKVFDLFPSEMIFASDIRPGDIAFVYARWIFVIRSKTDHEVQQEDNRLIEDFSGGSSYLPDTHRVKVVQRGLIDQEKAATILADRLEELREQEELDRQEDEEERERERNYLEERLRRLG